MKITRKDGIAYERNKKECKYDGALNCRCKKETETTFKDIALKKEIKYGNILRELVENYIEQNKQFIKR